MDAAGFQTFIAMSGYNFFVVGSPSAGHAAFPLKLGDSPIAQAYRSRLHEQQGCRA
ncbi:hypothetical protein [Arthrobacter sp. 35W]|uniref:hypothetical protein n=1 Tax=Arthrobacter sp. 35W TaxID=1132441 RepID=UPI0003F55AED|nr:hypothetical protein [Arthrobacter sp. 35W]